MLYGAEPLLNYPSFQGGVVFDVDPAELNPDQLDGAGTVNVDVRDGNFRIRKGWSYLNTAPAVAKVFGVGRYYPRDTGTAASYLLAASTKVWASDDATFDAGDEIATGLTGGAPMDFVQYRQTLYFGNGTDSLRRWTGSGASAVVGLLTAPTVGPGMDAYQRVLENFDLSGTMTTDTAGDLTKWQRRNKNNVQASWDTAITAITNIDSEKTEGDNSLEVTYKTAVSQGESIIKNFSDALTVDLSGMDNLLLWYRADAPGRIFKIGIIKNSGTNVDWKLFRPFVSGAAATWIPIRVPLGAVPPADRTAAVGIGIQLVGRGKKAFNAVIQFDQCMPETGLPPDTYHYFMTYGVVERINDRDILTRESNPGPEENYVIEELPPTGGLFVTPTTSAESGVNIIRFWRFRDRGPFRRARLVGTAPNATTTLNGALTATAATATLTTALGYSAGAVIQLDSEKMLVTEVIGDTLTITRAFEGTVAASHLTAATVTFLKLLDTQSDGELELDVADELVGDQIAPPLALTYTMANERLFAGNVTISGTKYPWRIYLSRLGFPEQFSSAQNPRAGADVPGWIDLPTRDHIRRIVEFDGDVILFCDRSIWSLQGTGWDDFALRQRSAFGLDARQAVAITDRLIYFLGTDGIRVLAPNKSFDGLFETWLISEPVNSKLRALSAANRLLVAMGVDERQRIWCVFARSGGGGANDTALVFDPYIGDLSPSYQRSRRGWHYYENITASVMATLKRGGGDLGQMIGGDVATGRIIFFSVDTGGADILTDNALGIAWKLQTRLIDAGAGGKLGWVVALGEWDAAAANVTLTPVLDGRVSGAVQQMSLAEQETGYVVPSVRFPNGLSARKNALRVSGAHTIALSCQGMQVGFYHVEAS